MKPETRKKVRDFIDYLLHYGYEPAGSSHNMDAWARDLLAFLGADEAEYTRAEVEADRLALAERVREACAKFSRRFRVLHSRCPDEADFRDLDVTPYLTGPKP